MRRDISTACVAAQSTASSRGCPGTNLKAVCIGLGINSKAVYLFVCRRLKTLLSVPWFPSMPCLATPQCCAATHRCVTLQPCVEMHLIRMMIYIGRCCNMLDNSCLHHCTVCTCSSMSGFSLFVDKVLSMCINHRARGSSLWSTHTMRQSRATSKMS